MISENVKLPLPKNKIIKVARKTLSIMGQRGTKVCIIFVNDKKMRNLNFKYRRENRATDCLAFPMREGAGKEFHPELLGDAVISVDTARRNARVFHTTLEKEISLYIIHTLLHLSGFNDTTHSARKKMRRREEYILSAL